jgi:hypothetical protein
LGLLLALALLIHFRKTSGVSGMISGGSRNVSVQFYPVHHLNRWGYMERSGKIVIQPSFNMALDFQEGLAPVQISQSWGYINSTGKVVIEPRYARADLFQEERARVTINPQITDFPGYIDYNGNMVIQLKGARFAGSFSEGLAAVQIEDHFGYIDDKGKFVIQPQFDAADGFSEGLAKAGKREGEGFQFGYIDKKGQYKIQSQFTDAFKFTEGLAAVGVGDQFGFINHKGEFVIVPQFEFAGNFSEGLAPVFSGKFGYINKNGKMVISPQFDLAMEFHEEMAAVAIASGDEPVWGFIDKTGKIVIEPQFDQVGSVRGIGGFSGGVAQIVVRQQIGYIDKKGNYLWKPCASCNLPAK